MKKMLAILMVAALFIGIVPIASAAEVLETGKCGPNATYTITSDGVMTISGTGKIDDVHDSFGMSGLLAPGRYTPMFFYRGEKLPAWDDCEERLNIKIKKIVIEEGITEIGIVAFGWKLSPDEIILPDSLEIIGDGAFLHFREVSEIKLPKNLKSLGRDAFAGCEKLRSITIPNTMGPFKCSALFFSYLEDVYFEGTEQRWNEIVDWLGSEDKSIGSISEQGTISIHFLTDQPLESPSTWATAEVNEAVKYGLVTPELQKDYKRPIPRERVAAAVVSLLEKTIGKTIDAIMADKGVSPDMNAFTDTSDPNVFAVNALGIIKGIGGSQFDPNGTLTRAQVAAIINRAAEVVGVNTTGYSHHFSDVGRQHWVNDELGWPVYAGILKGVSNDTFDPEGKLTTEQTILIILRAFNALK